MLKNYATTENVLGNADEVVDSDSRERDSSIQKVLDAGDALIDALNEISSENEEVSEKLAVVLSVIAQKIVRPAMTRETYVFRNCYSDVSYLQNIDSKDFFKSCNSLLTSFLDGITGRMISSAVDTRFLFGYAVVIESIYHLKNSNLVLPHCFIANLMQTSISGSKTVTVVNGKLLPGASDPIIREWWKTQGQHKLFVSPRADLDIFFDTVGKYIVKSYRVKSEHNHTPTVVTATMSLELNPTNEAEIFLQSKDEYKPLNWIGEQSESDLQVKMQEILDEGLEDFRQYRYEYVCSIFNYMLASTEMDSLISEEINIIISSGLTRKCDDCHEMHPPRKLVCDICRGHVSAAPRPKIVHNFSQKMPKYINVGQVTHRNVVTIKTCEPIMESPNSYESVTSIMDTMKDEAINKSEGRKWVFLGQMGHHIV